MNWRKLHRVISPILLLPLLLTALTGVAYRLGISWFGMSEDAAEIFMKIHQGAFLGNQLKSVYVLLIGLGLIGLIVTGILMLSGLFRKRPRRQIQGD
jgi:uncharacterized iron-regulated membrane protein